MVPLSFFVLGATFFLQQVHGGWIDRRLDYYRTSLTKPIDEVKQELEASLAQLDLKKEELDMQKEELSKELAKLPQECRTEYLDSHVSMFQKWDLEACLNLTGDWRDSFMLTLKIAIYAVNVSESFEATAAEFLKCPVKHFFKIIPCYYHNIVDFINDVSGLKDDVMMFVKETKDIIQEMRSDFFKCVGIPTALREMVLKHFAQLECS